MVSDRALDWLLVTEGNHPTLSVTVSDRYLWPCACDRALDCLIWRYSSENHHRNRRNNAHQLRIIGPPLLAGPFDRSILW